MKRNANICKVVSASLALFVSASPLAHAADGPLDGAESGPSLPLTGTDLSTGIGSLRDHDYYKAELRKLEESTRRIHMEVDRILEEFRKKMAEYHLRTRGVVTTGSEPQEQVSIPEVKPERPAAPATEGGKPIKADLQAVEADSDRAQSMVRDIIENNTIRDGVPFSALVKIDLSEFSSSLTDNALARIVKAFPRMQKLNLLRSSQITDKGLGHLKGLKDLKALTLIDCNITDAGLRDLGDLLKNLEWLSLSGCSQITNKGLVNLSDSKNLRYLSLSRSNITDEGLSHLGSLVNLEWLILNGCRQITGAGLRDLKGLIKLDRLDLSECNITDEGLTDLGNFKNLGVLSLNWCSKVTDAGLMHVSSLKKLYFLNLAGCVKIMDEGLKCLMGLENLVKLHLNGCNQITGTGLKYLNPKSLEEIFNLNLDGCDITDEGLENLSLMKNLQYLVLSKCRKITDAGLMHVSSLKKLYSLHLPECSQITDKGLEHLKGLENLVELDLSGCKQITIYGLTDDLLPHMKSLKRLFLRSSENMPEWDISALKRDHPNLSILRN